MMLKQKNKDEIEKEVFSFFRPLFNGCHGPNGVNTGKTFVQDKTHLNEFLGPLNRLSDEAKRELERPLEFQELADVIKELPNNKAPGTDGLLYEFYKVGFHLIGDELFSVYKDILGRCRLTFSMNRGATRLVPKVSVTPKIDQLRPITLLQCDYKILTKILTNRLLKFMPDLISSGQLCSVKGKSILFGASNMISILHYIEEKNLSAAFISFDQWKAYDSLHTILTNGYESYGLWRCLY